MAENEQSGAPANPSSALTRRQARAVARAARQIGAFLRAHGEGTEGQLAYLGQAGVRIVLVGADGAWGDVVAPAHAVAVAAAERAGLPLREAFDGDMATRVRTGRYEWSRMAGLQLGGARS